MRLAQSKEAPVGEKVTEEIFLQVNNRPDLIEKAEKCAKLKALELDESLTLEERDKAHDEYEAIKVTFPMWLVYEAKEGVKKTGANIKRTRVAFFDSDHIGDPMAVVNRWCDEYSNTLSKNVDERIRRMAENLHIVGLSKSLGQDGLHIFAELDPDKSYDENYEYFEKLLGLKFDDNAKKKTQGTFVETMPNWIYYSPKLFDIEVVDIKEPKLKGERKAKPSAPVVVQTTTPVADVPATVSPSSAAQQDFSFMGHDMKKIVEKWWMVNGGTPVKGERHKWFLPLACDLKTILGDNADTIYQAIASYSLFGVTEREVRQECFWACTQTTKMSWKLREAIELLNRESDDPAQSSTSVYSAPIPPPIPERLPPMIAAITSRLPKVYVPYVAQQVFSVLAVYLFNVKLRYIDNVPCEAALMSVTIAPSSGGKSAINVPIKHIMSRILLKDQDARARENQWKLECKKTPNSKQKPPRPNDIYVQFVLPDMTNAAFVQRLEVARGHYLFSMMDELVELDKLKTSNRGNQVSQIIRLAFDNGIYGQERVSDEAICAAVNIRWNWTASSTIQEAKKYFANGIADGTLSRISFAYMDSDPLDDMPMYGDYDESYDEAIKPYIDNLEMANGEIVSEEANSLIKAIMRENKDMASDGDDRVFATFAHRACPIAFRKAMILYIANGCKWNDTFNDFIRWSEQYDLWVKMNIFGDRAKEQMSGEKVSGGRGPQSMLLQLPERFTREQLIAVRVRLQVPQPANPDSQLKNWVKRGLAVKQDDGTFINKKFVKK